MAVFGADRDEVQGYLSISAVLQEGGHNFMSTLKMHYVQGNNFTYGYSQA